MRRCPLFVLLIVALASPVSAQEAKRTHAITVEDYFSIDVIIQHALSPSAFTLCGWDQAKEGRRVDLWIVACDTKKVERLTFDHAGVNSPRWSADGKTIYFLARHKREGEKQPPSDGSNQVWRIGVEGGQ